MLISKTLLDYLLFLYHSAFIFRTIFPSLILLPIFVIWLKKWDVLTYFICLRNCSGLYLANILYFWSFWCYLLWLLSLLYCLSLFLISTSDILCSRSIRHSLIWLFADSNIFSSIYSLFLVFNYLIYFNCIFLLLFMVLLWLIYYFFHIWQWLFMVSLCILSVSFISVVSLRNFFPIIFSIFSCY